jgi:hypothetical protein
MEDLSHLQEMQPFLDRPVMAMVKAVFVQPTRAVCQYHETRETLCQSIPHP